MGRDSNKRSMSWIPLPKPRTLGQVWQRGSGGGSGEGAAPGPHEAPEGSQADWQQLPVLPKWPPLPEEDPFASARPGDETAETAALAKRAATSDRPTTPPWDPAASGGYAGSGRSSRTVWQRFQALSRRARVGVVVAAIALIALVCTLGSVAALGGGLLNATTNSARNTPAGLTTGKSVFPTTGASTPTTSATATSASATPSASFAVIFTCASGSIGGTGQVCVHTQPNATLSLTVRYCDGNDATGKALRGSAHANSNGDYTWRWKVTTRCAGAATATVTAKSSGQTVTEHTTFTITR